MTLKAPSRMMQCTADQALDSCDSHQGLDSKAGIFKFFLLHASCSSLGPKKQGLPAHGGCSCFSPQCSYIPGSLSNYPTARADVEKVRDRFHELRVFHCFSATRANETSVLYQRLYGPQALLFYLFWPTFLLTSGLLIIAMVKVNQSLSILAAQK